MWKQIPSIFCSTCPCSQPDETMVFQPSTAATPGGWCGSSNTSAAAWLKDTARHGNCINICLPVQRRVRGEYTRLQFIIIYKGRPGLRARPHYCLADQREVHAIMRTSGSSFILRPRRPEQCCTAARRNYHIGKVMWECEHRLHCHVRTLHYMHKVSQQLLS